MHAQLLAACHASNPSTTQVYDVDGDGVISREDLSSMLRYMAGSQLSEQQREGLLNKAFAEAGAVTSIDFEALCKHIGEDDLGEGMTMKVPTAF